MADLKISQLPLAGTLTGAELFEVVQSGMNVQAALSAISPLIAQTALELAALVTPSTYAVKPYSALRYGALGNDANNDAVAAQTAESIASGHTDYEIGLTFRFVPQLISPFYFGNATGALAYMGVLIDSSNYTIFGPGAELHVVSRPGAISSDLQYCYSSAKNLVKGTQVNITVDRISVNSANDGDAANSNHRGFYFTGVDGVRFLNTRGRSSGARRGTFANVQNCKNVQLIGHYHKNQTQGVNFRYSDNMLVVGSIFDNFSECIDFDGTQKRAVVVGNCFESTSRVNQMLDVNGQVEAAISGFTAYNLGQVVNISHKNTTPDNFADYVNNVAPVVKTESQRVVVGHFTGSAIGSTTSVAINISNDWSDGGHAGYPCTHDVLITGGMLEDTGYVMVWECERLTIRDLYLGAVLTAASNYAVDLRSLIGTGDQRSWSTLTGVIDGLTINGGQRGGLRVQNPKSMAIRNVKVRGINSLGGADFAVQLSGLTERGAQITVDGLDIDGSGNININGNAASIAAWAGTTLYRRDQVVSNGGRYYRATSDSGTSAGAGGPTGITASIADGTVTWEYISEPFSVYWGPNNKLGAGCTIVFSGDAHKHTHGRMYTSAIGDLAATGTVSQVLYVAARKCYVARALATVTTAVGADAVNFRTFQMKSLTNLGATTTTISTANTQAGLTAYVPLDLGFAINEVGAYLEPGDCIFVDIPHSAGGKALTGLAIQLEVLEC